MIEAAAPPFDPFNLHQVEQAIAGTEFSGYLMHFPVVGSTNDLALEAAQGGARHGVWIADEQTAGRGRGNHAWHSEPDQGLYMSALISPPIPVGNALRLSLRTALAVQSAIASVTGLRVLEDIDIRWPNDLLIHGRKCGGILIETSAQPASAKGPSMLRHAVVGIGINCNHTSFPLNIDAIATSIRRELPDLNGPIRREPLAAAILLALDAEVRLMIGSWRGTDNTTHRKISEFSSWFCGKHVRVEEREGQAGNYTGVTDGVDANGFLRVLGDDGVLHIVLSGGVRAYEG